MSVETGTDTALDPRRGRPADHGDDVVVFTVGGRRFAVAGARVSEVARVEVFTPLPSDDGAVLGVSWHGGRVVSVLDPWRRLGVSRSIGALPWLCLFVRGRTGEVAVPVDAVLGFERPRGPAAIDAVRIVDLG
ncbi:MAG: chemotaxis protein CheW [Candidatus Rokubacteria bacterium]|nr:chemotaxis protein CheW [Candidatus Rokubacteria bacterium]